MFYRQTRFGNLKKKVLLLLLAGLALGLNRSTKKHRWIINQIPKELEKINSQALNRAIESLYTSHLLEEKNNKDGTTTLVLNENGKQKALRFNIDNLEIVVPKKWDRKWRIVMFDIPEKLKKLREALRFHFKEIGLIELQKSVLVFPYPCENEIEFVLELYNAHRHVRFVLAERIDNEIHLMKKFKLK
jgi:DNA-binding transcriptional regulator PaaX